MERASALYGRLLEALALVACALLFFMMLVICADVLLRNVTLFPRMRGVEWSNEASEASLYLITMLAAPWLLRRGRHIRVDILLRAIPKRLAWVCEWICDFLALGCCLLLVVYGAQRTEFLQKAYDAGWAGVIKSSPQHGPRMRELFGK